MVNGSYKCLNPQIRGVKRQVVFAIKSTKTITILMLMTFCYFKNSIIRVFQRKMHSSGNMYLKVLCGFSTYQKI